MSETRFLIKLSVIALLVSLVVAAFQISKLFGQLAIVGAAIGAWPIMHAALFNKRRLMERTTVLTPFQDIAGIMMLALITYAWYAALTGCDRLFHFFCAR